MPIKRTRSGVGKRTKRANGVRAMQTGAPAGGFGDFRRSYNSVVSRYQPRGGAGPITRMVIHDALGSLNPALSAGTYIYSYGLAFQLSGLPNITNLQALYDAYRIVKVEVRFVPNVIDTMGAATTSQRSMAEIWSCIDLNSVASLSDTQMMGYSTYKRTAFDKEHVRVIYPRTSSPTYTTAIATAYDQSSGPEWIPLYGSAITGNQTNVQHYGLNYGVFYDPYGPSPVPPAGINPQSWRVFTKYTVDFRGPL